MENKNQKLAELIGKQTIRYEENPYWEMKKDEIWNKNENKKFQVIDYKELFKSVIEYFKCVFDSFQHEAQVLVVREADAKYFKGVPELPVNVYGYKIFVLPQINTFSNTTVSEKWWQKNINENHIFPVMRIHSHHTLQAYQSMTDYSSLNSGTLEVVIGRIYEPVPEIAYWLDIRGTDNKENVFKTVDAKTVNRISPGNQKIFNMKNLINL